MQTRELAGVVIYNEHGELLLIHRNTDRLVQWELPGGKVESGETVQQTAIREAREEIGVDVEVGDILGSAEFDHDGYHWNYTWVLATVVNEQKPVICELEMFDEIAYFSIDHLKKHTVTISPNVMNLLQKIY